MRPVDNFAGPARSNRKELLTREECHGLAVPLDGRHVPQVDR